MTTSENLLENYSYLFPRVELIDRETEFKGYTFNSWEKKAIKIFDVDRDGNYNKGGFHIAGTCSDSYELIKNEDIFLPIADKLDSMFGPENVKIRVRWSQPFEYHLYFEIPSLAQGGNDPLFPMSSLRNSYTTQIPAEQVGMIGRLICTNGMMAISDSARIFKIKHTKKEAKVFLDMDKILKETEQVYNDFGIFASHKQVMNSVNLSALDGKTEIEKFESIIKGTDFPKRQLDSAWNIAQNEAKQLKQDVTLWLAYNALNHILWHDTQTKMTELRKNNLDSKLVTKVHDLALELA
jgi:hypothetical protein